MGIILTGAAFWVILTIGLIIFVSLIDKKQ